MKQRRKVVAEHIYGRYSHPCKRRKGGAAWGLPHSSQNRLEWATSVLCIQECSPTSRKTGETWGTRNLLHPRGLRSHQTIVLLED
jgi:hypothetical protein